MSLHSFTKMCLYDYYLVMDIRAIESRSQLMKAMRKWFSHHDYLEVDTPIVSADLIPEPTIQNFSTRLISEFLGEKELYLVPSPEVFMKKIIAATHRSVYQFSHCFRNSEQIGDYHNPEFTMLEYYTVDVDEQDSIEITERLFAQTALPSTVDSLLPPFRRMTVAEACKRYAGVDLDAVQSMNKIREAAISLGLQLPSAPERWEDTFNRIFLNFVEPNLPQDKPLVLEDYPVQIECLAKRKENSPYKRRWELYAHNVELANCYAEETDATVIRQYYEEQYRLLCAERANTAKVIPDIDPFFADIFEQNYPKCSGVALGFDRLLMLQMGRKNLRGVILFPLSDIIS